MEGVLAALFDESFTRGTALGVANLRPPALVQRMIGLLRAPLDEQWTHPPARNLDFYIEAQVHGAVALDSDVDALVADPSFLATPIGRKLEAIAERYHLKLHWHAGSALDLCDVPDDFRGPKMPDIARSIVPKGDRLTAALIGNAARAIEATLADHRLCRELGSPGNAQQQLKLLWHCLLRYGTYFEAAPSQMDTGSSNRKKTSTQS